MKKSRLLLFSILMGSITAAFAQMQSGKSVIINDKVDHDLYVAGGRVTINAIVKGDLVVAGGTITITDTVTQDLLAAGSDIILDGYIGDDIRSAGGTIKLSNSVAGDVIVTGGKVEIDKGVIINGNLIVSGGEVTLDGEVKGNVKSASGEFALNGIARNDLDCRGGNISINGTVDGNTVLAASTIVIGSDAHFNKDVKYWNKAGSLDFKNALHNGKATFDPSLEIESGKWRYLGFASFLILLCYLGTALLMIGLIQYFFRDTFKKAADTVKNASLKSLGLGFLFLVGVPIAIVITMITLVGIPIGILALIGYVAVLLLGTVVVSLLATHWINNTFYQHALTTSRILIIAFGIFIFLKLASLTPFVGPAIMFILVCMAFGGILQHIKWKRGNAAAST
ncbi:MAG: hypothetical protein OEV74_16395 [Cyclobacteriaceae bacterium]|nr:hypothetical protein [Cyclobacteriaceae bacterium]